MIRLLIREEDATKGQIFVGGKNLAKLSTWDVPKLRRNGHRLPGLPAAAGQDGLRERASRSR